MYAALNAKKELRAPNEYGLCIRTSHIESESSYIGDVTSELRCIACETERSRQCWLAAMRLAKVSRFCRIVSKYENNNVLSIGRVIARSII